MRIFNEIGLYNIRGDIFGGVTAAVIALPMALAFGVAALNCGFETISIRSYLASSIERLTSSRNPADQQRLQFIIDESDHLARFCAF